MPPAGIRRPVTVSVWLILSVLALALSPALLAVAALASAIMRRPVALIAARLLVCYFARELGGLVACGWLWVASGGGRRIREPRFQVLHWRLVAWFARGFSGRACTLLGIAVTRARSEPALRALRMDQPLLFLSRHAGPADTVLLLDALLSEWGRRPSVVFKRALLLDPCIDLVANRLPQAVVEDGAGADAERRIETIAAGLEHRGVLLLFPEGGNFSYERRRRAIGSLTRRGRRRAAIEAERLQHVLPPRPGGMRAALRGNPRLPIIFAAHTGLGLASRPRQLWHDPPIGKTLHTRMWLVPATEIPSAPAEQAEWLNAWWSRLDTWIEEHGSEPSESQCP